MLGWKRPALVTSGHSWVAGRYPNRAVMQRPQRVGRGLATRSRGIGGSESPEAAEQLLSHDLQSDERVVIEPFLNDVRRFGKAASGLVRTAVPGCS